MRILLLSWASVLLLVLPAAAQGDDVGRATEAACCGANCCNIGGDCFMRGNANPANACEMCDPSSSQAAWTNTCDAGTTPAPDAGPPEPDAGATPRPDAGTTSMSDAGVAPPGDAGTSPAGDAGSTPMTDAGTTPTPDAGGGGSEDGGCAVRPGRGAGGAGALVLLTLGLLVRRRALS